MCAMCHFVILFIKILNFIRSVSVRASLWSMLCRFYFVLSFMRMKLCNFVCRVRPLLRSPELIIKHEANSKQKEYVCRMYGVRRCSTLLWHIV